MGKLTEHFLQMIHLDGLINDKIVQALIGADNCSPLSAHGGGDREWIAQMRLTINIGDGSYDLEEGNILVEEVSIVRILSGSVVLERCLRREGLQRNGRAFTEALENGLGRLQTSFQNT